jgi:hypothetical protein
MGLGQVLRLDLSYPATVSDCMIVVCVSISLVFLHRLCYNVGTEGPQGFLA